MKCYLFSLTPRHSILCIIIVQKFYTKLWLLFLGSTEVRLSTMPCQRKSTLVCHKSNTYILEEYRVIACGTVLEPQFSSVVQSCPTLCDPMNRSTPGLPVHHQLPEFTQTHVHWVGNAIQPSSPLSSPSPPAPNSSQHQRLFQWVNSSDEVAKVLEFQL